MSLLPGFEAGEETTLCAGCGARLVWRRDGGTVELASGLQLVQEGRVLPYLADGSSRVVHWLECPGPPRRSSTPGKPRERRRRGG